MSSDDAIYEVIIEFVSNYGFDQLSMGDLHYDCCEVGTSGALKDLSSNNQVSLTEQDNPQTGSVYFDTQIIERSTTTAFVLKIREDDKFISEVIFSSTDILTASNAGRYVPLVSTAGRTQSSGGMMCDVRLHAWILDEDGEPLEPRVNANQRVLRALRPWTATELQRKQGAASQEVDTSLRRGDQMGHFDQQTYWPSDDRKQCRQLELQMAYLNAMCSAATCEAGCDAHRSYYLGRRLRAVECGLCLQAGRRFFANASLNVARADCFWLALKSHFRCFHGLSLRKCTAAMPASKEAVTDDDDLPSELSADGALDADVAELASLFSKSAAVNVQGPEQAEADASVGLGTELQPGGVSASDLSTALPSHAAIGTAAPADGGVVDSAREEEAAARLARKGIGSAEWARAHPAIWQNASTAAEWPLKSILKPSDTADPAAADSDEPDGVKARPPGHGKTVQHEGATFVSLTKVLPSDEQRALRWKGADRELARAEHNDERLTALRYFADHSVVALHRFVRYFHGQNWLYTQPQPVRKATKGREYPVPAHMVSLRLCGINFGQFKDAFEHYAAEHLDSDAGKAAREQANRELFDSLFKEVKALKGFGLSVRGVSKLAAQVWRESPDEREARRAAMLAAPVEDTDSDSSSADDSDSDSDSDASDEVASEMVTATARSAVTLEQAQLPAAREDEEKDTQEGPEEMEGNKDERLQEKPLESSPPDAQTTAALQESEGVPGSNQISSEGDSAVLEEGEPRGGWTDHDLLLLLRHRDKITHTWLRENLRTRTVAKWTRRTSNALRRVLTMLRCELTVLQSAAEAKRTSDCGTASEAGLAVGDSAEEGTGATSRLSETSVATDLDARKNAAARYDDPRQTNVGYARTVKAREKAALKASRAAKGSSNAKGMELEGKALRREVAQFVQDHLFHLAPHLAGRDLSHPAVLQWLYELTAEETSYVNFCSALRAKKSAGQQGVHDTLRRVLSILHRMVGPTQT